MSSPQQLPPRTLGADHKTIRFARLVDDAVA